MQMKNKILIGILVVLGIIAISSAWFFIKHNQPKNQNNISSNPSVQTSQTATSSIVETKTYTNKEFGFEFQYPKDWMVTEGTFSSPSSLFNLEISPSEEGTSSLGMGLINPIINIVTAKFGDNAFKSADKESDITVGGVKGKRYEDRYEVFYGIDILLPFGQNRIILGTEKRYENVFNGIITSFKFLN